jgi:hypothetical protein
MGSVHGWMGETGSWYGSLVGNIIENIYWEDLGDGRITLKMDLRQIVCEDRTQIQLADDHAC